MAPLLALLSSSPLLLLPADPTLHASLASLNTSQLTVLDDKIKDAIANLGETEISDAHIAKAQYYAKIGDKVKQTIHPSIIYISYLFYIP